MKRKNVLKGLVFVRHRRKKGGINILVWTKKKLREFWGRGAGAEMGATDIFVQLSVPVQYHAALFGEGREGR